MREEIGCEIMKEEGGEGMIVSCARHCFQRGDWVSTPGLGMASIPPDSNYLCIGGVVNEQQAHSLKTITPFDKQWIYRVFTSVGFSGY